MLEAITHRLGIGRRSWKDHLVRDIAVGLGAGYVGTKVIERAIPLLGKLQAPESARKEHSLISVPANQVLANRISDRVFRERSTDTRKAKLGMGLHYGYGVLWGGIYGALHRRVPFLSKLGGVPFGILFGLIGNELVTSALRLVPPPQRFPVSTHVKTLASHVAYAVAADGAWRAADRLIDRASGRFAA